MKSRLGSVSKRCGLLLLTALTPLTCNPAAGAELTVIENADGQQGLTVFKMTVTPAAESEPALKHRLIPGPIEMRPGNAALFYMRAYAEGSLSHAWKAVEKEFGFDEIHGNDKTSGWYNISRPLDTIPREKQRKASSRFDTIYEQFIARGAVRNHSDWGHNIHEISGTEIVSTLLPEIQESRSLSRAVMLRTRLAVAEKDYDRAIQHLRYNYQLGRHVAEAPFLVSGLVGIAIASMSNAELVELIAAEDSPNLYWALAELPRPMIDLQPSVKYEMSLGPRMFPALMDAENRRYSPQEWGRVLAEGVMEGTQLVASGPHLNELGARMGIVGLALATYPQAKSRLIEQGMDSDAVERMPVGQVIAIDASRQYQRVADEYEKWWYTPYAVARERERRFERRRDANMLEGGVGQMLADLLIPALTAAREAQLRLDWQLDALQTVEAIRMHAAETGKFPASLEEIEIVPVPVSPITNKPYAYRLDGETAVLELPANELVRNFAWRFEITLADK